MSKCIVIHPTSAHCVQDPHNAQQQIFIRYLVHISE